MIEQPSQVLVDDDLCFGCGCQNPIGLHLTFEWDGDSYGTIWTPLPLHQGWAGRVHGGLIALTLDEVLARAALERYGLDWVTAALTTRLRRPARTGVPLRVRAQIESVRRSLITCRGEVRELESDVLIATGEAKLMRAK